MNTTIRVCTESDLEALQQIGYETYDETFRDVNSAETINAYLAEAFYQETLLSELRAEGSAFYFLHHNNDLAGYVKLSITPNQSDLNDPNSLEIERIYVRKRFKGQGLGKALMDFALRRAAELGKQVVWLGVWEKNIAAIAFYRKAGFMEVGKHSFRMGDELQTDCIMKKAVEES